MAGKVHFTKTVEDLEQFIPRGQILKELGGDEEWSYQYIEPSPDENSRMSDTATMEKILENRQQYVDQFEQETLKWLTASSESEPAKESERERAKLTESLRRNYWEADPYLRARTVYDRSGLIKDGGVLDFYPTNGTTV